MTQDQQQPIPQIEALREQIGTTCRSFGTGNCCHDTCFDISKVLPEKGDVTACDKPHTWFKPPTDDRTQVTCRPCLEVING